MPQTEHVCVCVFPPTLMMMKPSPQGAGAGGGALGRWWAHEGELSWVGTVPLWKDSQSLCTPPTMRGHSQRSQLWPRGSSSPDTAAACTWVWAFGPPGWAWSSLSFPRPRLGYLLQQPHGLEHKVHQTRPGQKRTPEQGCRVAGTCGSLTVSHV